MPHNRELMQVFKDVGLVEQLGSGMSQILKAYDKSIFDISEHFIKVQIPFFVSKTVPNIANGDEIGDENKILAVLKREPAITAKKLSETLNVSTRKISRIIKMLRKNGTITRVGSDRKGYWKINKK